MTDKTREPQYQICLDRRDAAGYQRLGLMSNQVWLDDPRRLGMVLARYKFVAKMLSGRDRALEVGSADAFGTRVVQQEVPSVTTIDFDPLFVSSARENMHPSWPFEAHVHDMLEGPFPGDFDGAYSLDVVEHISASREDTFIENISRSITPHGVVIIGTPSVESQQYASPGSKAGHVNCKSGPDLKKLMLKHFHSVFVFSMNDEVVHTGYYPMAQYLLALCCGKRGAY